MPYVDHPPEKALIFIWLDSGVIIVPKGSNRLGLDPVRVVNRCQELIPLVPVKTQVVVPVLGGLEST